MLKKLVKNKKVSNNQDTLNQNNGW